MVRNRIRQECNYMFIVSCAFCHAQDEAVGVQLHNSDQSKNTNHMLLQNNNYISHLADIFRSYRKKYQLPVRPLVLLSNSHCISFHYIFLIMALPFI